MSFANFSNVLTGQRCINVLWVSKIFNCSLYNGGVPLTMSLVYFSVVKSDRNTITNYDRNRKLHDIQKRELVLSICKTLRVYGVHRNVTQYSPVLQRFSAKTNELSRALIFSYSWHISKLSDLCSCPLISFQ